MKIFFVTRISGNKSIFFLGLEPIIVAVIANAMLYCFKMNYMKHEKKYKFLLRIQDLLLVITMNKDKQWF